MERDKSIRLDAANLIEDVMREYDLQTRKISKVRKAYRVETNRGTKFLKHTRQSEEQLRQAFDCVEHLYKNGFRRVPRFLVTKYGEPYVKVGNDIFYAADWRPGKECKLKKSDNLERAAFALGELHQAAQGFSPVNFSVKRPDWVSEFQEKCADLERWRTSTQAKDFQTQFDQLFLNQVQRFYQIGQQALKILEEAGLGEVMATAADLCHCSYTSRNLLEKGKEIYVLDFDHCGPGWRLNDLGKFMTRYLPKVQWDTRTGLNVLHAYESVASMTANERKMLLGYLYFPLSFWRLGRHYYQKRREWPEGEFVNRLREEILQQEKKQIFVTNLLREGANQELFNELYRSPKVNKDSRWVDFDELDDDD